MKLTSLIMLAMGYWLLFAAGAIAAGQQDNRNPWTSSTPSLLSLDDTRNINRQVMTGYTGTKDKGKRKISGSRHQDQDAHSPPSYPEEVATDIILDAYGKRLSPKSPEDLQGGPHLEPVYTAHDQGKQSTLGGWNGQHTNDHSFASKAWPGHNNDLYSKHLRWSGYEDAEPVIAHRTSDAQFNEPQSYHHPYSLYAQWLDHHPQSEASWSDYEFEQHLSPAPKDQDGDIHSSRVPRSRDSQGPPRKRVSQHKIKYVSDEIKNNWEALNRMLTQTFKGVVNKAAEEGRPIDKVVAGVQQGILCKAPPSWYFPVVDNPFGPVEERSTFADTGLGNFVSKWANEKRNWLADVWISNELTYMRREESSKNWIMKEDYTASGASKITSPPAAWFSEYAKPNPIKAYVSGKNKASLRGKDRRTEERLQRNSD